MDTRPRREKFIFDCPNDKEYCFLQKKIRGERKCVTYKKSIHFMCRYNQPVKKAENNVSAN